MPTVKTAISLERGLLREAEGLARKLKLSRSRVFAAMEEFIERRRNGVLLDAINAAYAGSGDAAETKLRNSMRRHHRDRVCPSRRT